MPDDEVCSCFPFPELALAVHSFHAWASPSNPCGLLLGIFFFLVSYNFARGPTCRLGLVLFSPYLL